MAKEHPLRRPAIPTPASEQPGNSWRYLYQRLSEKQFQQLCGALLRNENHNVRCFPVGMSDGGIDAEDARGDESVIYQVKWSSKTERDPVAWLKAAVEGEWSNVERLVKEGATKYFLMTSVAGTSIPTRGSMARMHEELAAFSKRLGIEIVCLWQADIDAMVDVAPDTLKWSYQEMLAGADLIRFLIHGSQVEGRAAEMRETLIKVMATQWGEDSRVKFSQVEMDHLSIVDLFVDVEEELESPPGNTLNAFVAGHQSRGSGAVKYLLNSTQPLTLVRGEPGQGKSTLGQYLCQIHRSAILEPEHTVQGKQPEETTDDARLPLRTDLRDYASWLKGRDPYGVDEDGAPSRTEKPRRGSRGSLENFLAHYCAHYSGGRAVTVEQIQDVLQRYPVLVVLDGLDEVAEPKIRRQVVEEIDNLARRLGSTTRRRFQMIVTTRPNSTALAEPSRDMFETVRLRPLSDALQTSYLRKWADVNDIRGARRRRLAGVFRSRAAEDHISQLADNPMQLTILLYLMNRRGESVPEARTPLYTSYMETLLDREVIKSDIVKENRRYVEEVTSYLGWHIQARTEVEAGHGRMGVREIERALLLYLHEVEGPRNLVETIFAAVSDRFWALSSKSEGTFEFAVQPVREYFAARFLAEYAGTATGRSVLKGDVLRELVLRSYWFNTARFYAGFASPNELAGLVDGLEIARDEGRHPLQVRVALWSLLGDGVFVGVTRAQRNAARLLADDLSIRFLVARSSDGDDFSHLAAGNGGADLAAEIFRAVEKQPQDGLNIERVSLLRKLGIERPEFEGWWLPKVSEAAGTASEATWLRLGAAYMSGARVAPETTDRLALATLDACRYALALGIAPEKAHQGLALLRAVLDGHGTDVETRSTSLAGDLLRAVRPQHFLALAKDSQSPLFEAQVSHYRESPSESLNRSTTFKRLSDKDPRYKRVQRASTFRMGEKGTTAPWQNCARELCAIHGPSWLAADIAITGAATTSTTTGGSITRNGSPFGPSIDYGTFVEKTRANKSSSDWWREQHRADPDPLSRATWALAIVAVANEDVLKDALLLVDATLTAMSDESFDALASTSSRLGASNVARRLSGSSLAAAAMTSGRTRLVVAHHCASLTSLDSLDAYPEEALVEMVGHGDTAWPAVRAITIRLLRAPSNSLLAALRLCGPNAVSTIPSGAESPGSSVVSTILAAPHDYPSGWVLAAERWHSQACEEPALARVATAEGWVPDLSAG